MLKVKIEITALTVNKNHKTPIYVTLPSSSSDFLRRADCIVPGVDVVVDDITGAWDGDDTGADVVVDDITGAWDGDDTEADVVVDDITGAWDGDDTGADVGVDEITGAWDGDDTGADVVVDNIVGGSVDGSDEGDADGDKVDAGSEIEEGVVVGAVVDRRNTGIVGDCDGNHIADDDVIGDGIDIVEGIPTKIAITSERMEDEYIIEFCFILLKIILRLQKQTSSSM